MLSLFSPLDGDTGGSSGNTIRGRWGLVSLLILLDTNGGNGGSVVDFSKVRADGRGKSSVEPTSSFVPFGCDL